MFSMGVSAFQLLAWFISWRPFFVVAVFAGFVFGILAWFFTMGVSAFQLLAWFISWRLLFVVLVFVISGLLT